MSIKLSTGLRAAMLATGSLKSQLDGGEIRIYSGPEPTSAAAAITGSNVLLCKIKTDVNGGLTLSDTAPGGTITKNPSEVWQGTVLADGVATFFRFTPAADDDTASSSFARVQGAVGNAGSDMYLSSTSLVTGAVQRLEAFALSLPEV